MRLVWRFSASLEASFLSVFSLPLIVYLSKLARLQLKALNTAFQRYLPFNPTKLVSTLNYNSSLILFLPCHVLFCFSIPADVFINTTKKNNKKTNKQPNHRRGNKSKGRSESQRSSCFGPNSVVDGQRAAPCSCRRPQRVAADAAVVDGRQHDGRAHGAVAAAR